MTTTTTRQCERCGLPLVRRQYSTALEAVAKFARRRFCSPSCSNACTPKPAPISFAAEYRVALARGFDPFELNDAAWED